MLTIFAERGGDPQRVGKSDPLDALIWLRQRGEDPGWPSPFGSGRPGWHIECCAIAHHYLSPDATDEFAIDIQGGGSDLIFPHHEMSAAQTRVITNQKFARTFVHCGMVGLDGQKMSKSLGNLVFVSRLLAQGVHPSAIRWALMGHRYSEDLMWNDSLLDVASAEIERLHMNLARMEVAPTDDIIAQIIACLAQDLDTAQVLQVIRTWMDATEAGSTGGEAGELSRALDSRCTSKPARLWVYQCLLSEFLYRRYQSKNGTRNRQATGRREALKLPGKKGVYSAYFYPTSINCRPLYMFPKCENYPLCQRGRTVRQEDL